ADETAWRKCCANCAAIDCSSVQSILHFQHLFKFMIKFNLNYIVRLVGRLAQVLCQLRLA
ncbi:MAG: hypothetical protein RR918_07810, partial [Anaerovoracaceae bacterium]